MIDLDVLTIEKAAEGLRKKEYTSRMLTEAVLARIKERDPGVHAFLEVFDDALAAADAADARLASGDAPLLCGIPIAVKDNMLIKGHRVSAASKILEQYTATYDATAIKKLKDAGAVLIGRTNMDEFAMGSSTENSAFGVTKNPHDLSRVAGGSSGGSAAAVTYGGALGSYGSDTGGSIRQPAALCGIVGMKPTYGAVSRSGLIAMGSSLDIIGPFAKTVRDAKILFDAVRGNDPLDATSLPDTVERPKRSGPLTIGVPRKFLEKGVDPDVLQRFNEGLKRLEAAGATIRDIDLPHIAHSLAVYYIIMPAEASTNLSRFDGVKYGLHKDGTTGIEDFFESRGAGFGPEPRRRILLGTYVLSSGYYDAFYNRATAVRRLITDEFKKAFTEVDCIATPTTPTPAFKIGEKSDPLSMYLADIFTVPANIAGIPALSVPLGTVEREGTELPVGFQIMSAHNAEDTLFEAGAILEGKA